MSLSEHLAELVPWMQGRAEALDRDAAFPAEEVDSLRRCGALSLPLPVRSSTRDDRLVDQLAAVLTLTGRGNLSVGRILEAHVNALHLIGRYGSPGQWRDALRDVEDGHLFALWVTDPPAGGLRMQRHGHTIHLTGAKQFCSAAGHATRALVTAQDADGSARMLILRLGAGETVTSLPSPLQGMRAAVTGAVDFSGCETAAECCVGRAGDYLREPDFSTGAWRGSAVALGGLIALLDLAIDQLRVVRPAGEPAQPGSPRPGDDRPRYGPVLGARHGTDRGGPDGAVGTPRRHRRPGPDRGRNRLPRRDAAAAALARVVGVSPGQPGGTRLPRSLDLSAPARAG